MVKWPRSLSTISCRVLKSKKTLIELFRHGCRDSCEWPWPPVSAGQHWVKEIATVCGHKYISTFWQTNIVRMKWFSTLLQISLPSIMDRDQLALNFFSNDLQWVPGSSETGGEATCCSLWSQIYSDKIKYLDNYDNKGIWTDTSGWIHLEKRIQTIGATNILRQICRNMIISDDHLRRFQSRSF